MTNGLVKDDRAITQMAVASMSMIALLYVAQTLLAPREIVFPEAYGNIWFSPAGHIMNVGYGDDEEPEYIGEAVPGTLNSDAGWRIYRYEYVIDPVTDDMLSGTIRYAGGTTGFDKVWDDREDYEYS